ncbi:H-NS family nucleoid-associated regulatory protein [Celeribacter indicus]|uniref:Histone-like nucleoid-structuring protein H-NS n=1 Tax=Celeribacter indicus TaxID=1208324 RepID=A0A0B5E3L4_9RHOB|nr:H-NS histone family protein [Celeribacter indicus]AJE47970.1 histone-like nucleoid-structuring protein H-NS [Celeribacter indicus]SDW28337.1 DNA-binding protein H-NS [Celeribacter indicus]
MANIDLSKLDLEELKTLQKDVAKAIDDYTERKRREALAAAQAVAKEAGFTLDELVRPSGSSKKPALPAKYRHPENPEVTWSGRGRQPQWIKDGLAQGKSLKDFAL